MLLGFDHLKALVAQQQLVERLPEKELAKDGGVAFDLRLAEVREFVSEGMLGIDERKTPDTKLLGSYDPENSVKVTLEPNKYYVVKTIEKVNTPLNLAATVLSRSTLYRSGLILITGLVDPGYQGELTFGLMNLSNKPFTIELGSRIANLMFTRVDGKTSSYDGNYQGGAHGTDKS